MNLPDGWSLVQTCSACPEQYDLVTDDGSSAGYIRFRWGRLTAHYPDAEGDMVYSSNFGDAMQGCLEDGQEHYLEHAVLTCVQMWRSDNDQ